MTTRAGYMSTWRGKAPTTVGPLSLALQGEDGRYWYREAHAEIVRYAAEIHERPERVAQVLAVTSPRVTVDRNVRIAVAYLNGDPLPGYTLPMVHVSLRTLEETGEIRGPKTSEFARALMGDPDAAVVDVWVLRGLGRVEERLTPKRYRAAATVLRALATRIGWPVAEFQAALWRGARRSVGMEYGAPLTLPRTRAERPAMEADGETIPF